MQSPWEEASDGDENRKGNRNRAEPFFRYAADAMGSPSRPTDLPAEACNASGRPLSPEPIADAITSILRQARDGTGGLSTSSTRSALSAARAALVHAPLAEFAGDEGPVHLDVLAGRVGLEALRDVDPDGAQVVMLRCFAGRTWELCGE